MNFRLIPPSPLLSPFVRHYWFLEMEASEGTGQPQRVVPNGYVELTFHFGDRLRKIKLIEDIQPGIIISGQKTDFFDVVPTGKTSMLSIQFYPHSAGLFFDIPISELANETLDLREIAGQEADELEDRLGNIQLLDNKVILIERFLTNRLKRVEVYEWDRIAHNIALIGRHNGQISVEQLAGAACLSRKQHERVFKKMVGLSPKQFLKVIRFQYALLAHQQHPHESLTELAYRCGYYDQSHMINDFRDLSGITPGQYFNACETPYSDYFE